MNAKVILCLVLIFGYCQAKGELVFSDDILIASLCLFWAFSLFSLRYCKFFGIFTLLESSVRIIKTYGRETNFLRVDDAIEIKRFSENG